MTNLWRVVELKADPLKPTQPMDASGMKAPTPDRHSISTQPSLHTLHPYREITKLLHSLLLSWEPAPVSSLYKGGAGSPIGEEVCCSAAHTSREKEDAVPTPPRLWAHSQPLCTVTSLSRSHGVSEMPFPVIMPTLLYASVEGAARELWDTRGGG